jgi:transcriptional regulator with XRE-family HTH domain
VSAAVTAEVTDQDRAVAERLLQLRIAARLTPRELARAAGLPADTVNAIENTARPATPAEIAALAGALDLAPDALGGGR